MIKIYKIKLADKVYEVEVEAISEKEGTIETTKKVDQPKATTGEAKAIVEAPMQGVVLSVDVSEGQSVKKGDVLIVLEAMKMENPILAPEDGVVSSLSVTKGQKIDSGTVIMTLS